MSITESVLSPLLKADAARPLITHYDDAVGSRVELSVVTTANWAAKTANWLCEEGDIEPGDPVACLLPPHWQTLGILFGIWWCGATVTADAQGSAVAFVPGGTPAPGAGLVAEVSLHPMGLGLGGEPASGAIDFIEDSRLCGDNFSPLSPVGPETPAIGQATIAEVLAAASAQDIPPGTRALSTSAWTIPTGLMNVLAIMVAGGSLVQCGQVDESILAKRAETEKTTLRL